MRFISNPKASKHRELPVDVPDSFIGIAKQSPRYPPPKPHRQVSPSVNNLTTFNHTTATANLYNSSNNAQQSVVPPIAQSTAASIFTHNSSLRSSVKLKQLEKSRNGHNGNHPMGQMQPAINQAFELNEDDNLSDRHAPKTDQAGHSNQSRAVNKQASPDPCAIYKRLNKNLNGEFADISADVKLAKLLSIYQTIVQTHDKQFKLVPLISRHNTTVNALGNPEPVTYKVSELLQSVIYLLNSEETMTNDAANLLSILNKHELDGVCSAFDRIGLSFNYSKSSSISPNSPQAMDIVPESNLNQPPSYQNEGLHHVPNHQLEDYEYAQDQVQLDIENNLYQNSLHPLTDIDLSDGTCTKTVRIEKTSNQALGATIKNDVDGSVIIGRIVCGGAAHRSGLLHEGDEILEVNGVQMRGKNVNEVVNILEGMNGTLTFTVVSRGYTKPNQRNLQEKIFVRAFFKYDGENDDFIPCKELDCLLRKVKSWRS